MHLLTLQPLNENLVWVQQKHINNYFFWQLKHAGMKKSNSKNKHIDSFTFLLDINL